MIVGVIGCGSAGSAYIRALSCINLVEQIYIYDSDSEKTKAIAKKTDNLIVSESIAEIALKADAIVVALPNNIHLSAIKEIYSFSKVPVICEKPFTDSIEAAKKLSSLLDPLSIIGFNYRFNPIFKEFRAIINQHKSFGKIIFFQGNFLKSSTFNKTHIGWRDENFQGNSSGAVGDLSPHIIDLFTFLTGQRLNTNSISIGKFTRVKKRLDGDIHADDTGVITGYGDDNCLFRARLGKAENVENTVFDIKVSFQYGEINFSGKDNQIFIQNNITQAKKSIAIKYDNILPNISGEIIYWLDSFIFILESWLDCISKKELNHLEEISSKYGEYLQSIIDRK